MGEEKIMSFIDRLRGLKDSEGHEKINAEIQKREDIERSKELDRRVKESERVCREAVRKYIVPILEEVRREYAGGGDIYVVSEGHPLSERGGNMSLGYADIVKKGAAAGILIWDRRGDNQEGSCKCLSLGAWVDHPELPGVTMKNVLFPRFSDSSDSSSSKELGNYEISAEDPNLRENLQKCVLMALRTPSSIQQGWGPSRDW
jgi:hypothetical protein